MASQQLWQAAQVACRDVAPAIFAKSVTAYSNATDFTQFLMNLETNIDKTCQQERISALSDSITGRLKRLSHGATLGPGQENT